MIIILLDKDPAEFCVESLRRMVEGHCRFQMFWKLSQITINCYQIPKTSKLSQNCEGLASGPKNLKIF